MSCACPSQVKCVEGHSPDISGGAFCRSVKCELLKATVTPPWTLCLTCTRPTLSEDLCPFLRTFPSGGNRCEMATEPLRQVKVAKPNFESSNAIAPEFAAFQSGEMRPSYTLRQRTVEITESLRLDLPTCGREQAHRQGAARGSATAAPRSPSCPTS